MGKKRGHSNKQPDPAQSSESMYYPEGEVKKESPYWWHSFPQRLEHLRNEKFESKESFARRLGMSRSQYDKYLAGSIPGGEVIERIVLSTGCDTGWLLTGTGRPFPTPDPAEEPRRKQVEQALRDAIAAAQANAATIINLSGVVRPEELDAHELADAAQALATAGNRLDTLANKAATSKKPPKPSNP